MQFSRSPLAWGLVALAVVGVGCGPEASAPGDVPETRVVLGTGQAEYQPLPDGATVPLIKGIQGAFHVEISFLAYGFDTDVLRMDLTTRWEGRDDSPLGAPGNVRVRATADATGAPALAFVGWPAVVFDATCGHGRRLRIELTVLDTEGRSASDTRRWIVDVPEADRSSDCGG
jgi:hypothetical protein